MVDSRHPNTSVIAAEADHLVTITIQAGNNLIIQWFHGLQLGCIERLVGQRSAMTLGIASRPLKLHSELPRGLSSLLIQMRTGNIGLRKHLHGRKVPEIDTPICQCGQAPQSVTHVLAHCRKYSQIRRETWKEEEKNHAWRSIPVKEMLSSPRYAKKAAMFMKKTGLLGQFKALRAETDDTNVTDAF